MSDKELWNVVGGKSKAKSVAEKAYFWTKVWLGTNQLIYGINMGFTIKGFVISQYGVISISRPAWNGIKRF